MKNKTKKYHFIIIITPFAVDIEFIMSSLARVAGLAAGLAYIQSNRESFSKVQVPEFNHWQPSYFQEFRIKNRYNVSNIGSFLGLEYSYCDGNSKTSAIQNRSDKNNINSNNGETANNTGDQSTVIRVRPELVEQYISLILSDTDMNIRELPDRLERQIYSFAIQMALDACVRAVYGGLHNMKLLGHRLEVELIPGTEPLSLSLPIGGRIDRRALQDIVQVLLDEKMVNISWLPDRVESRIYFNVLLLIFSVIQSFLGATKLDIVGHTLEVSFAANGSGFRRLREDLKGGSGGRGGVSEEILNKLVDELLADDSRNLSMLADSIERSVFKTLYALILCVVREIADGLALSVLGDRLLVKLVPDVERDLKNNSTISNNKNSTQHESNLNSNNDNKNDNNNNSKTLSESNSNLVSVSQSSVADAGTFGSLLFAFSIILCKPK